MKFFQLGESKIGKFLKAKADDWASWYMFNSNSASSFFVLCLRCC